MSVCVLLGGVRVKLGRVNVESLPRMNKKHIILAIVAGVVIGTAWGRSIPVVKLAAKLPGASL